MTNRDYLDYLQDILDATQKARQFLAGQSLQDFKSDDKTAFAVIRALEIIGEAAKKVPLEIRNLRPALPWREMASMRDKLIHDYSGIVLEVVWKTVREDLPAIEEELQAWLAEL